MEPAPASTQSGQPDPTLAHSHALSHKGLNITGQVNRAPGLKSIEGVEKNPASTGGRKLCDWSPGPWTTDSFCKYGEMWDGLDGETEVWGAIAI